MCSLCDKKLCKTRKFGIGQEITFPNLTDLQVVALEEPYYYMNVDGDRLYLDSAKHLTNQSLFQEECVKQLRFNPPTLKTNDWKKLTNILLTNAEITEPAEGTSTKDILRNFDRKNNAQYEKFYNDYLEIMRQGIVKLFNKNKDNKDKLIFYNSDGTISGACGNGTRCVAKLLSKEYGKEEINLETSSGNLHSLILKENLVETNIGTPSMEWDKIPLIKEMNTKNLNVTINDINGEKFTGGIAINVGNPHMIFFVENNENYEIENIGPAIEQHEYFPEKCNVTIATIKNESRT